MLDDLTSTTINCGALAGYTVPPQGPLSGVTVSWDESKMPQYGTVTCDTSCTSTNADGVATLHFQPYDELLPGQGTPVTVPDAVIARAYPSKSNGIIFEALGVNKKAFIGCTVSYHDPGG
ncbi:MAG: hypothetical protein ACLP01_06130 [Solirubrobacteraceae bacterium]